MPSKRSDTPGHRVAKLGDGKRAARRESAQQRAYAHLKEQITAGALAGGEYLTESVIAEELGISRTPVREALFRLDVENLVRLVPGRGAFVPEMTERVIREVMEVRSIIETHAVTKLGCPIPAELQSRLDAYIHDQRESEGDPETFIRLDRTFHQAIVDSSGSSLLSSIYRSMRDQQTRMGVRAVIQRENGFESVLAEHHAIAEALTGTRTDVAVQAVEAHLHNTIHALLDT